MSELVILYSSLQADYDFIIHEENKSLPEYNERQQRYQEELKKCQVSEREAFRQCLTVKDIIKYFRTYGNRYYYNLQYAQDALDKLENFYWEENKDTDFGRSSYLQVFPHGRYAGLKPREKTMQFKLEKIFLDILGVLIIIGLLAMPFLLNLI